MVVAPVISLNGTTAKALLNDLFDARVAVGVAIEKFAQTAPHGRDYPTDFAFARSEFEAHRDALARALAFLDEKAETIAALQ